MFVIFGLSHKRHPIQAYQGPCQACRRETVQIGTIDKRAFSIFWVPLVPLGSGKRLICLSCGSERKVKSMPVREPYLMAIQATEVRPRMADLLARQATPAVPPGPPPGSFPPQ